VSKGKRSSGAKSGQWVLRLVLVVLIGLVLYAAVTFVQVWLTSRRVEMVPAQAIVIMGAAQYDGVPSPDLTARLQDALALYHQGLAPLIVATGSKQPGDTYTEAEASARWLTAQGVPQTDVAEVGGNDSWSSLSEAAALLRLRGDRRVLIATDGFHEDRSLAIATDVGLRGMPVPATDSPISGWSAVPYFAREAVAVALGRFIGYSHLHGLDMGGELGALCCSQ
jgi:vancomycin permeability regulator SanA